MRTIQFEIKKAGPVSIRVLDILGKQVSSAVNNYEMPGNYEYAFNSESLMPGRYYYRIYDWSNSAASIMNGNENLFLLQSGTFKIGENWQNKIDFAFNL